MPFPAIAIALLSLAGTAGIEFYFWQQNDKTSQQILDAIGNVLYGMSFTDFLVACCLPLALLAVVAYIGYWIANPVPDGRDLDDLIDYRAEKTFIKMYGKQKGMGKA